MARSILYLDQQFEKGVSYERLPTPFDRLRDHRYRAIRKALWQLYPEQPKGNLARHLTTLTALICGIVGSQRTNFPQIAEKVLDDACPESRVKRFSRWIDNDRIDIETYFLPYAQALIASLAHLTFLLVMDSSKVGRGCATLVLNVVYKNRALPLCWMVTEGNKGHFSEQDHLALIGQIQPLIPPNTHVVFLGDGEFDLPAAGRWDRSASATGHLWVAIRLSHGQEHSAFR